MKSVVSLLAMAPDRAAAANWASEIEKNGFALHSADEIKRALGVSLLYRLRENFLIFQDSNEQTPALVEQESFDTPGSERFVGQIPNPGAASYDGSSRGERQVHYQYPIVFGDVY